MYLERVGRKRLHSLLMLGVAGNFIDMYVWYACMYSFDGGASGEGVLLVIYLGWQGGFSKSRVGLYWYLFETCVNGGKE